MFFTVFTRARHWSVSPDRWMKSRTHYLIFSFSILIKLFIFFRFPNQSFARIFHVTYQIHITINLEILFVFYYWYQTMFSLYWLLIYSLASCEVFRFYCFLLFMLHVCWIISSNIHCENVCIYLLFIFSSFNYIDVCSGYIRRNCRMISE